MKMTAMALAVLAAALSPLAAGAPQAGEGRLAQLYAPRPPAGSAFVRVVNPGGSALAVGVANGAEQRIGPAMRATRYAIVEGGKPFNVRVAGGVHAQPPVAAGSFTTLVLDPTSPQRPPVALDDGGGSSDALKAEIRFYNLAASCPQGRLAMAADGPVVFASVAAGKSSARAINPVKARLVAGCGGKDSAAFELPALQPGDHYSLFLTGSVGAPALQGQLSGTDAVGR
ncbi:alginate O-acetyltransferase AlgF [Stenotrophomonas sp. NLF4-10]|uniref:alginate O-acetyltransferase AlgF n=1 Tax=Stenotrophomonas sp. NLF4-10 TaxID=2918754 RepID=UPI001EFA5D41|nr:alginate O-acetyltransferase AlgF [Stenotrophomonas sp. NLF4-10]MCG8275731.1 alginate O-acetyltransferase AlgF [Stenotrophomonas sp. NLF4-10]